ncbi:hypothetical protein [Salmonella phage vB_StyS-sam]|uniref:Uncharacterized protein n=1 Tax=Salmonella phage vB_StyS-sam TaxID=2664131 RepID=A0A5K7YDM6_9CAUD|nr:hypothetical protein QA026_gp66 [Salmonella phage vB_StyS-sam]BBO66019.1 hypothetical protein [Salmonella phage vB_StyS-sam]
MLASMFKTSHSAASEPGRACRNATIIVSIMFSTRSSNPQQCLITGRSNIRKFWPTSLRLLSGFCSFSIALRKSLGISLPSVASHTCTGPSSKA